MPLRLCYFPSSRAETLFRVFTPFIGSVFSFIFDDYFVVICISKPSVLQSGCTLFALPLNSRCIYVFGLSALPVSQARLIWAYKLEKHYYGTDRSHTAI